MLSELKELLQGLGIAILLLFSFVWIREKILSTRRSGSDDDQSDLKSQLDDSHNHSAFESTLDDGGLKPRPITPIGIARVNKIFITAKAGADMQRVASIQAMANRGLKGDRYSTGRGYWSDSSNCEVTFIAQEDLDQIEDMTKIGVQDGQHRRNIVTTDLDLQSLKGKRFRVGTAYFAYQHPRPPCLYIQKLTEPGMVKALAYSGGHCVRCFKSGQFSDRDTIEILNMSFTKALVQRFKNFKNRGNTLF